MEIDVYAELPGVGFQVEGGVARIELRRPERGNSLTPEMQPAFRAIWKEVRENPDIRVAILAAAGDRHFCTGFDVSEADGEDSDQVFKDAPLADSVHWSPHQNQVWKPVLCLVTGLCVGGGLHFVVDSDIVIASENAAFMDSHVNVGMVGAVENVGLARRLPVGTALRMTLLGSDYRLPARRAYELGLVDELVASATEAEEVALQMAASLLKNSPQAMYASKKAVWGALEHGYSEAMERGWSLLREHWRHPDFAEGPRAFAEKRTPRWDPAPVPAKKGEGEE